MTQENHESQPDPGDQDSSDIDPDREDASVPRSDPDTDPMFVEIPIDRYRELEDAIKERDDFKERLQRLSAELENFKKRSRKKRKEDRKYAEQKIIKDLLPVLDDFDQALQDRSEADDNVLEGFRMIRRKLFKVLEDSGVEQIDEEGVEFDPRIHEAVSRVETNEVSGKRVRHIARKGYRLHDRILRSARVVVAVPPDDGSDP